MKVLFLSPWFPYPPTNGSKIRIYHLLRALACKHEITLLSFVRDGEQVDEQGLADLCPSIHTVPWREFTPGRVKALLGYLSPLPRSVVDTYHHEMTKLMEQSVRQARPDVVVASEVGTARYVPSGVIPRVLDDLELGVIHDAWANASSPLTRWRRGLTWAKVRRYKSGLVRRFDACTVVSERERALLDQIAPAYGAVHVIPNGVDLQSFYPGLAEPRPNTLIYNGALTYSANYDAMQYFLEAIFPRIRIQAPEVELRITGSIQSVDLAALPSNNGVKFTDYLPDIRPAVAGAWACVVPLRVGSGTRLKILEAMALGTPVIATSKGAEGLDVTPGENILIADELAEFAARTVQLLRDPGLRDHLARNGRRLVEAKYGWGTIGRKFERLVDVVANARRES